MGIAVARFRLHCLVLTLLLISVVTYRTSAEVQITSGDTTIRSSASGQVSIEDKRFGKWLTEGRFLNQKTEHQLKMTPCVIGNSITLNAAGLQKAKISFTKDGSISISSSGSLSSVCFKAEVKWGKRPLICRLSAPEGCSVVHFSSGPVTNYALNALFDIDSDRAVILEEGSGTFHPSGNGRFILKTDIGKGVLLRVKDNHYRDHFWGIRFYKPLDKSIFPRPISGWMSWYHFQWYFNEQDLARITDWIALNLKQFGCEYIQIDSSFLDDSSWTKWNAQFPHGGKWQADYIHSKGLKAGLWLTPFSTREKDLAEQHPDWFIKKDGKFVESFVGPYTIDATNPEVLDKWLAPLIRTLVHEWGYDMLKLDGLPDVLDKYKQVEFYQKGTDYALAYRKGLETIRNAAGKETFILSCWGCPVEGVGFTEGFRTSADTNLSWGGIKETINATRAVYLNNIIMYTDPDAVWVREPLTLNQARAWASLVALTGQMTLLCDKLYALPEERVEILRRILPVCPDIYPSDLHMLDEKQIRCIDVKFNRPFGSWDVIGLFNWENRPSKMRYTLTDLGLPPGSYYAYDFWNKRFLGKIEDAVELELEPASCRIISLHPVKDIPQVVSTSRHVTQGGIELKELKWNPKTLTLSGVSELVGGDPYEVRIAVPVSPRTYKAVSCGAEGSQAVVTRSEGVVLLKLNAGKSGDVTWHVRFRKDKADHQPPTVPESLSARSKPSKAPAANIH